MFYVLPNSHIVMSVVVVFNQFQQFPFNEQKFPKQQLSQDMLHPLIETTTTIIITREFSSRIQQHFECSIKEQSLVTLQNSPANQS